MRTTLAIALVLATGLFIATTMASKGRNNYPHFFKHRTKLREIRGFKPEYISTAIGFGKRESPADVADHARERILLSLLRNFSHGVPAKMLLRMMQMNPALAGKLTQLPMRNDNGDEESMMDHSKPERMLALF